jgi:hypothetical protein
MAAFAIISTEAERKTYTYESAYKRSRYAPAASFPEEAEYSFTDATACFHHCER